MALSDTTIIDIELTDTFETWRTRTNRIITLVNESADEDPFTSLVSANSEGGFSINSIQSKLVPTHKVVLGLKTKGRWLQAWPALAIQCGPCSRLRVSSFGAVGEGVVICHVAAGSSARWA